MMYAGFHGVQRFVKLRYETEDKNGKNTEGEVQPGISTTVSKVFKESGLVLAEAAKRLFLPKGTLKNWIYADKQGELAGLGKNLKPLSDLELELSRIKRELSEVRMERDFVKKCAAYFAKESH